MLQVNRRENLPRAEEAAGFGAASFPDVFGSLTAILRHQLPVFLVILGCSAVLGILYLVTTPPSFTAYVTLVLDSRKVQLFQQQSVLGESPVDTSSVQTQVEVLKSENVSLNVIRSLHLVEDPEFVSSAPGLIGSIIQIALSPFRPSSDRPPSATELERRALSVFENQRTVSRTGMTYVMEVSFRSLSPQKSAAVANAIADAYIADQLEAKYDATRRASAWLQDRIRELSQQATDADRAAVNFRKENNINAVDSTGKLMNEQQLSEINSQLIIARASTAEAKARLDRITDIMRQPVSDASLTDALKNEVIIKLRTQYLELASREAIWSAKYGANHLATISLRTQMQQIRQRIGEEMQKIAQGYQSDYEIAQARENSIKSSLANSVTESQSTSQAQIVLRDLEGKAQTARTMYDNFSRRYMEAVQQQSFPISEARVIGPASPPTSKSQPKTPLVLAATVLGGLFLSFGIALVREVSDRVYRTGAQVEAKLDVNCLAVVPEVKQAALAEKSKRALSLSAGQNNVLETGDLLLRHAVDSPFSHFTEAVRSIKLAVDLADIIKINKVIGVTSGLPNEGKSTISANFAQLVAHAGARILLVDGDLRNPSLSRALAPSAKTGLIDVLGGRKTLEQVIFTDPITELDFLPVGGGPKLLHTSEILGSEGMQKFVASVREKYDYIIFDFAPLAPVIDTRVTTGFIDSYVLVVEWGRTKTDVVEHVLAEGREVYERLLGVVLNKADMNVLGRYERHRSGRYYQKYYRKYGYVA